jgi:uncharacterized protein (TIGR02646 family)
MINVKRLEEPVTLVENKVKWLEEYLQSLENYRLNPSNLTKVRKERCENKYRQNDIKNSLKNMFEGKCAYCESHLAHISYGHIEHFKPKSKFPNDCFNWENLLLGCEICNGTQFKSTNFPLENENGPLVNPTTENPFIFFDFEYDPNTGLANVLGKNDRGITTEKLLGLNRPELLKHRSKIVRRIVFIAIRAAQGDKEARKEMRKLIQKDEEYSAFAISISTKLGLEI